MTYPDSVRYLYSLGNELKVGAKFTLDRMNTLMLALGSPQRGIPVVHVAGTNGKGSTCAMIDSIARAAGIRTGLNTSPHLIEPTERIQIDGVQATDAQFAAAFDVVHAAAERLIEADAIDTHPSYFETVTAMAFVMFQEAGCELNVIEVGLGGRLDATNVVEPAVTVITPVSYDHEAFLGNTIEAIAGEKAGILKPGVPLILGRQDLRAQSVILGRASELGCPVQRVADHTLTYDVALEGEHQRDNALAAALTARQLQIGEHAIAQGLRNVHWPGRLEVVNDHPRIILDGAHNPAGAVALAAYIEQQRSGPVWIVYGAMRDKAIEEVTATLFPLADRLVLTAPDFPRALRPEAILQTHEHPNRVLTQTVAEAVQLATQAPPEVVVFITGSLYVVGEARRLLTR